VALRATERELGETGEQLVANGGIEEGSGGLPEGWSVELPGAAFGAPEVPEHLGHVNLGLATPELAEHVGRGKLAWTDGARRSGRRGLEVQNYDRALEGPVGWVQTMPIDIRPGEEYALSFWGRRSGECEAAVVVDVAYGFGAPDDVQASVVGHVPVTSPNWARYEAVLQPAAALKDVPEGAATCGSLLIRAGMTGVGRAWFDDFQLVRRAPPEPEPPAVAATPGRRPAGRGRVGRPAGVSIPAAAAAARAAVEAANRRTRRTIDAVRGMGAGTEGWQRGRR
jgi:hypothetical protein